MITPAFETTIDGHPSWVRVERVKHGQMVVKIHTKLGDMGVCSTVKVDMRDGKTLIPANVHLFHVNVFRTLCADALTREAAR